MCQIQNVSGSPKNVSYIASGAGLAIAGLTVLVIGILSLYSGPGGWHTPFNGISLPVVYTLMGTGSAGVLTGIVLLCIAYVKKSQRLPPPTKDETLPEQVDPVVQTPPTPPGTPPQTEEKKESEPRKEEESSSPPETQHNEQPQEVQTPPPITQPETSSQTKENQEPELQKKEEPSSTPPVQQNEHVPIVQDPPIATQPETHLPTEEKKEPELQKKEEPSSVPAQQNTDKSELDSLKKHYPFIEMLPTKGQKLSKEQTTMLVEHYIKEGFDINANKDTSGTLLYQAIIGNNETLVSVLIDTPGIDLNTAAPFTGDSPLQSVISVGSRFTQSMDLIKKMIKNGARLDLPNKEGDLPMHTAFMGSNKECAEYFLDTVDESTVNIQNKSGCALAHFVATSTFTVDETLSFLQKLLTKGAEINLETKQENTPLSLGFVEWINSRSEDECLALTQGFLARGAAVWNYHYKKQTSVNTARGSTKEEKESSLTSLASEKKMSKLAALLNNN